MASTAPPPLQVDDLTRAHYDALDGLRGLAIVSVMLYHFCLPHRSFHGADAPWLLQAAQAGWLGVDLFFVLSGFLITGILLETRAHPHYFRNFLGRRFLRIWPLYYASLLVLLVLLPMVMPTVPPQLQGMQDKQIWFWLYAANWLFVQEGGFNNTSGAYFWSLAVEEQFYLVWPLVVYWLAPRTLLRVSLAMLAGSLLLRLVLLRLGVPTGSLYPMTFTHLDGLAVGSFLAVAVRDPALMARVQRLLPWIAGLALGGLAVVRWSDGNLFFWSRAMTSAGYSLAALLFGALLVWALAGDARRGLRRVFTSAFLRQAGKYSYALYVIHVPVAGVAYPLVQRLLARLAPGWGYDLLFVASLAAAFGLSWGLAVLSWHLFEKRILGLKRYFSYSAPGAPAAAAGPGPAVRMPPG